MIDSMRMSGPTGRRQWWWANLWHVINVIVGATVALLIAAGLGSRFGEPGQYLAAVTYLLLALFFIFVWPPIPKAELAIRALLRRRREVGASRRFESAEPGAGRIGGEGARELGLHVAQRNIPDRSRGEE
jgi:hypothetical protein